MSKNILNHIKAEGSVCIAWQHISWWMIVDEVGKMWRPNENNGFSKTIYWVSLFFVVDASAKWTCGGSYNVNWMTEENEKDGTGIRRVASVMYN